MIAREGLKLSEKGRCPSVRGPSTPVDLKEGGLRWPG